VRQGAQKAIDSWELRERAIRRAEARAEVRWATLGREGKPVTFSSSRANLGIKVY